MLNGHRHTRHSCDVCNAEALYCSGAVVVIGKVPERGRLVAQCPQCRRFVCSEHAQRADCHMALEALEAFRTLVQHTGFLPMVLCCPWHGVPLGEFQDWYVVVGNAMHQASAERQFYAREYLENPQDSLESLTGLDLSQRHLASREALAWPLEQSDPGGLLERLQAAQRTFEASGTPQEQEQSDPLRGAELFQALQRAFETSGTPQGQEQSDPLRGAELLQALQRSLAACGIPEVEPALHTQEDVRTPEAAHEAMRVLLGLFNAEAAAHAGAELGQRVRPKLNTAEGTSAAAHASHCAICKATFRPYECRIDFQIKRAFCPRCDCELPASVFEHFLQEL